MEQAKKVALFHEHLAKTPGLDADLLDSSAAIAAFIRSCIKKIVEHGDAKSLELLCDFLGLQELHQRFKRNIERPNQSRDRDLGH